MREEEIAVRQGRWRCLHNKAVKGVQIGEYKGVPAAVSKDEYIKGRIL